MSQFRKKPVVIQAQQWLGPETPHPQVREFSDVEAPMGEKGRFYVETLEGPLRVSPGDWIIRGVKGEFYPCKPDIFAATYESVEAADDDQRRISPSPATLSAEAGARLRGELASGLTVARLAALLRETIILCAPSDVERVDFEVTAKRLLPQLAMSRGAPTPAMIEPTVAMIDAALAVADALSSDGVPRDDVVQVLRAALAAQEQP